MVRARTSLWGVESACGAASAGLPAALAPSLRVIPAEDIVNQNALLALLVVVLLSACAPPDASDPDASDPDAGHVTPTDATTAAPDAGDPSATDGGGGGGFDAGTPHDAGRDAGSDAALIETDAGEPCGLVEVAALVDGDQSFSGDTTGAPEDEICYGPTPAVIYQFTVPGTGDRLVSFSLANPSTTWDTVVEVRTAGCAVRVPEECHDESSTGSQSAGRLVLPGGSVFHLALGGYDGESGPYLLSIDVSDAPEVGRRLGDMCGEPVDITGGPATVSPVDMEMDFAGTGPRACAFDSLDDAYFRFTVTQTSDVVLHAVGARGISFLTSCTESEYCTIGSSDVWDLPVTRLPAGTYYNRVLIDDGSTAPVTASVDIVPTAEGNDRCAGAIDLSTVMWEGRSFHGFEDDFHGCGAHAGEGDAFYVFDLPSAEGNTLQVSSDIETDVTVLDGCGGTQVACSVESDLHDIDISALPPGRYIVVVDGDADSTGAITYSGIYRTF